MTGVRPACHCGIQLVGEMRFIQHRQRLPFLIEPGQHGFGVRSRLEQLRETLPDASLMAYANIGRPDSVVGWVHTDAQNPARYAQYASAWLEFGAAIVGGCCGTTPEHVRRIRRLIDERFSAR